MVIFFMISCLVYKVSTCKRDNKNLVDHLMHLFVHGVLHLIGYDHQTEEDAHLMESLEVKILKNLNIDSPYK